jgi:hypothetical protein
MTAKLSEGSGKIAGAHAGVIVITNRTIEKSITPPKTSRTNSLSRSGLIIFRDAFQLRVTSVAKTFSRSIIAVQHIHNIFIGRIVRNVMIRHHFPHTLFHTRNLIPIVGPFVVLPTRIVAAKITRVFA